MVGRLVCPLFLEESPVHAVYQKGTRADRSSHKRHSPTPLLSMNYLTTVTLISTFTVPRCPEGSKGFSFSGNAVTTGCCYMPRQRCYQRGERIFFPGRPAVDGIIAARLHHSGAVPSSRHCSSNLAAPCLSYTWPLCTLRLVSLPPFLSLGVMAAHQPAGPRAAAELPLRPSSSSQPLAQTLTGKQEHCRLPRLSRTGPGNAVQVSSSCRSADGRAPLPDLKRELISEQAKFEINELNSPTALRRFGAPFRSDQGEVSPQESELPILRYIFVHHVRDFPFLDKAREKEFWQDKLQVVCRLAHASWPPLACIVRLL